MPIFEFAVMRRRESVLVLAIAGVSTAGPSSAQGPGAISPPYFAQHEGYVGMGLPFGADNAIVTGTRYQQFQTEFVGQAMTIAAISLRADQDGGKRSGLAMNVDLELRIGPAALAGATTNFNANYSAPAVVAMSRRVLSLPARSGEATSLLGPFDVTLPFDQPYAYDGLTQFAWETICRSSVDYRTTTYESDFVVPQVNAGTVGTGFASRSLGGGCNGYELTPSGGLQTGASPNLILGLAATAHRSLVGTPTAIAIGVADPAIPLVSPLCTSTLHTDALIVVAGSLDNAGRYLLGVTLPWQPIWSQMELTVQAAFVRSGGLAFSRGLVVQLPQGPPPAPGNANLVGLGLAPATGSFVDHGRQLVVRFTP